MKGECMRESGIVIRAACFALLVGSCIGAFAMQVNMTCTKTSSDVASSIVLPGSRQAVK
jgi:hypothetical protein